MVDTVRSISALLTQLFQDGQPLLSINPQRFRDLIVSVIGQTVILATTDDLPAKAQAYPEGTKFYLPAGTFRLTAPIVPRTGQQFIGAGQGTTYVTGAIILNSAGFTNVSGVYHIQASVSTVHITDPANCAVGYRCQYANDLYVDNVLYQHVTAQGSVVAGTNTFFIDYVTVPPTIYMGTNPSGHLVEVCQTELAFDAEHANSVNIENMTIEKFACAGQYGAIGTFTPDDCWTVSGVESRFNHGVGIKYGKRWQVARCYIHHNGQLGASGSFCDGSVLETTEIAYNNTTKFLAGWEAGGLKVWTTNGSTVRHNYAHHNGGPGLWWDTDNYLSVCDNNRCEWNDGPGIFYEISYDAIIRGNYCAQNSQVNTNDSDAWSYAEMYISTSQNVEIYGNQLVGAYCGVNAFQAVQQTRGTGNRGLYQLRNIHIHDNDFTVQTTWWYHVSIVGDGTQNVLSDPYVGIVLAGNQYHCPEGVGHTASVFLSTFRTFAQLQSAGFEAGGGVDTLLTPGANLLVFPFDLTAGSKFWTIGANNTVTANAGDATHPDADQCAMAIGSGNSGTDTRYIKQNFPARLGAVSIGLWVKGTNTQQVYLYLISPGSTITQQSITFNGSWQQIKVENTTITGTGNSNRSQFVLSTTDYVSTNQRAATTFLVWSPQANEGPTLNASF